MEILKGEEIYFQNAERRLNLRFRLLEALKSWAQVEKSRGSLNFPKSLEIFDQLLDLVDYDPHDSLHFKEYLRQFSENLGTISKNCIWLKLSWSLKKSPRIILKLIYIYKDSNNWEEILHLADFLNDDFEKYFWILQSQISLNVSIPRLDYTLHKCIYSQKVESLRSLKMILNLIHRNPDHLFNEKDCTFLFKNCLKMSSAVSQNIKNVDEFEEMLRLAFNFARYYKFKDYNVFYSPLRTHIDDQKDEKRRLFSSLNINREIINNLSYVIDDLTRRENFSTASLWIDLAKDFGPNIQNQIPEFKRIISNDLKCHKALDDAGDYKKYLDDCLTHRSNFELYQNRFEIAIRDQDYSVVLDCLKEFMSSKNPIGEKLIQFIFGIIMKHSEDHDDPGRLEFVLNILSIIIDYESIIISEDNKLLIYQYIVRIYLYLLIDRDESASFNGPLKKLLEIYESIVQMMTSSIEHVDDIQWFSDVAYNLAKNDKISDLHVKFKLFRYSSIFNSETQIVKNLESLIMAIIVGLELLKKSDEKELKVKVNNEISDIFDYLDGYDLTKINRGKNWVDYIRRSIIIYKFERAISMNDRTEVKKLIKVNFDYDDDNTVITSETARMIIKLLESKREFIQESHIVHKLHILMVSDEDEITIWAYIRYIDSLLEYSFVDTLIDDLNFVIDVLIAKLEKNNVTLWPQKYLFKIIADVWNYSLRAKLIRGPTFSGNLVECIIKLRKYIPEYESFFLEKGVFLYIQTPSQLI